MFSGARRSYAYTPSDNGPDPYVAALYADALRNDNFRAAIWTGEHLQTTLMSILPGEDIGIEIHPDVDQFIYIIQGRGVARMGESMENLSFESPVTSGDAIFVPFGTWHNVINAGRAPLKLFSIYAPPEHPHGVVHPTKADAEAAEKAEAGK